LSGKGCLARNRRHLSDGALWNWEFIKEHYPGAIWILDFWHAAQHLSQAADIIFGRVPREEKSA
jgi:hypothetical protein